MHDLYDIQTIERGLVDVKKMIPQGSFDGLYTTLCSAMGKLHEPMQLAIIGKISSSKSTLVNAILGKGELMSTGQKEVTYNVGWLKYGKSDADIVIHHKDNTPNTIKSQAEFAQWTVNSGNSEIDNISYIETFNDAEILKEVNIIDTPGLDALLGKDSQNTLDFIQKVRPDAVIMLFTHSVSQNVLDIVSQFNAGGDFNPLNAVGVLSKIDKLWQEDLERDKTALQIGQKMAKNGMRKYPMLKKTLFDIYPISALLFLASATLSEEIFGKIKTLKQSNKDSLDKALDSVDRFSSESADLNLALEERKELVDTLDLFGIHLLLELLEANPNATLSDAKAVLKKESGADDFMKILHNHFGARAKLIKIESVYQSIVQSIGKCATEASEKGMISLLTKVEQQIKDLFSSQVYEHKEYELLCRIYNNVLDLDEATRNEICNLFGEHGFSAPERLGISGNQTLEELAEQANARVCHWRRCVALEPDPEEREWMNTVLASYTRLNVKLKQSIYQYQQAKAFLFNM